MILLEFLPIKEAAAGPTSPEAEDYNRGNNSSKCGIGIEED
jgi:hypothetical protein